MNNGDSQEKFFSEEVIFKMKWRMIEFIWSTRGSEELSSWRKAGSEGGARHTQETAVITAEWWMGEKEEVRLAVSASVWRQRFAGHGKDFDFTVMSFVV